MNNPKGKVKIVEKKVEAIDRKNLEVVNVFVYLAVVIDKYTECKKRGGKLCAQVRKFWGEIKVKQLCQLYKNLFEGEGCRELINLVRTKK